MALTKVKLISDGVIVQGNLHSSHGITTSHISEGSNLYYTTTRGAAAITASNTDALSEGSTNLYYTNERADARVALIVDSSPATLNTLNELAAALGDDPNFATTTANSIGLKLPLAGGTMTGAITTNSTFDGRDVATDGAKLDGIEALADVTDATNVTAAGALMDSELTSIASVKALNQGVATGDVPTFAGVTDGYITWGAAQLNRYGAAIELQFTPTNTATLVKIGANGSYPTIFNAYNGNATFSGNSTFTGNLTVDTNTLFVDATNNRVGAGTTSPQANFHAVGTIKVATGNAQGILALGEGAGTTVNTGIWRGAANNPTSDGNFLNLGGYDGIVLATGNAAIGSQTERMRIDSSGRVGIGVTPSYANVPLHTKNIGGGDSFNIFEGIGNAWVFGEADQTGTKYCQVAGRYGHHSGINVDLVGNVGIGTVLPQKKVHIEGTGGASEMQILVSSANDTVGYTAGIGLRAEGGEADSDVRIKGGIFFERIAGSYGNGKMILAVNSSVSNTSVTVADHALTIDTNKNVGIGVTNPETARLLVRGSTNDSTSQIFQAANFGGASKYVIRADGDNKWYRSDNSISMVLSESGNVGIGITGQSNKLMVVGSNTGTQITTLPIGKFVNTGNEFSKFVIGSDNTNYDAVFSFDVSATLANAKLRIYIGNGTTSTTGHSNDQIVLTGSGKVGIGTTSPNAKLSLGSDGGQKFYLYEGGDVKMGLGVDLSGSSRELSMFHPSSNGVDGNISFGYRLESTGAYTEKMRITGGGHILLGNTTASLTSDPGFKYIDDANTPYFGEVVNTSTGNGYSSFHHYNTNAAFNGFRFYVLNNGGIVNYSSNNTNLSDERVKNNIEDSGNYLNKICSIPIRLFNYKDEPEGTDKNLGVIAQEVEAIAPELVNNDGFGETPEDGIPLKTIYSNDMMYALMKSIQELKADNDSLKARIETLEDK